MASTINPISLVRRFLTHLAVYWDAMPEGSAAARTYEELIRRGAPHEAAAARTIKRHFDHAGRRECEGS